MVNEPTFPGCRHRGPHRRRLQDRDKGQTDRKLLAVPHKDPLFGDILALDDVPHHFLREVEHFFQVYKELEKKKTAVIGWRPREEALTVIERALEAYPG